LYYLFYECNASIQQGITAILIRENVYMPENTRDR
jgi:hypothetical protein